MTVLKLYPNVIRWIIFVHLASAIAIWLKIAIVYSESANIAKTNGNVPPLAMYVRQEVCQENAMQTSILVNTTHF